MDNLDVLTLTVMTTAGARFSVTENINDFCAGFLGATSEDGIVHAEVSISTSVGNLWVEGLTVLDFWNVPGGGSPGGPSLAASGPLAVGSVIQIQLWDAPASVPAVLAASTSSTPLSLFGGTLYPLPIQALLAATTDANGTLELLVPIGPGTPVGTKLYLQSGVLDAVAPSGVSLSNALQGAFQ